MQEVTNQLGYTITKQNTQKLIYVELTLKTKISDLEKLKKLEQICMNLTPVIYQHEHQTHK